MGYGDSYAGGYAPDAITGAVSFSGAGSFTAAGLVVSFAAVSFSGEGTLRVRTSDTAYEVVVVDKDGVPFGTLVDARLGRISWELNGTGSVEVSLPTTHPSAELMIPGREIQVYYETANPIFWGPIVRPQLGLDESTWQCAGLFWYFEHRFMGRADRVNQLVNGGFEDGETGWSFSGVTHSIDTGTVNEDAQSLKLTGGTADHATFAYQIWTHPVGGYPTGDFLTASFWVYVPSADYVGGAANDYGLVVIHRDADGNVVDTAFAEIGDDTEKNAWIPLEALVKDVKEDHTVEVRLFPPHGVAYFDTGTLTYMESLSFYPGATEVTDIILDIVKYAQDRPTLSGSFNHGKSDLNIDTDGEDTGVTRALAYQFAEHRNIADAILEYVRNGTCDIDIELTPTSRTFTVYPTDEDVDPRGLGKGSLYGTTLELDVNLSDFSFASDLENAASHVVMLGPGDGPDRPEGGAIDLSFVGGAFTSEIVEQATDDTTVGQLDARAEDRLRIAARPEILEVTTLPGAGIIGDLVVGDTVPVVIDWGCVDIDDTYRVARIEADLLNGQATLTLNPIPA